MKKSDRQRLRSLVTDYIENTLKAEKYDDKVFLIYDYGVQTKYGILYIALDRDYEWSELFTVFSSFKDWPEVYPNPHLKLYSNKYNFHVLLKDRTVEDCFNMIKAHLTI